MRVGSAYNQANIFFYNYSDGTALGIKGPNGDNYLYSHVQVDAQGSFRLAKGFPTVVYGLNLTNEVFGFYQGRTIYPIQREYKATPRDPTLIFSYSMALSRLLVTIPSRLLAISSGVAFPPGSTNAANCQGSRSPCKMAPMIFMPLTPLRSLSTLLSCTFISVNTFCMR